MRELNLLGRVSPPSLTPSGTDLLPTLHMWTEAELIHSARFDLHGRAEQRRSMGRKINKAGYEEARQQS